MLRKRFEDARILALDDEPANLDLLRRILSPAGYENLITTSDPHELLRLVEEEEPDLVLLDLLMPELDGYAVMAELNAQVGEETYLPVLVLTSDASQEARRRGLAEGAKDYLTKPLSPPEVRLRVRNLLETRFLHQALQDHNVRLEERVRERTSELERARFQILRRLAQAAEYRDDDTGEHTRRVGWMSGEVAAALGLPDREVELIRTVAPLHDVGKIGIPDRILLKPDRLEPDEEEVMQTHTVIGGELLGGSEFNLLEVAAEVALSHHERWDGAGYPKGLKGSDIPLTGRIVAVADTYDALRNRRPYKSAWTHDEALVEIRDHGGAQFDPDVVDAFAEVARNGLGEVGL